ncbi:hypothetical protein ACET3Z_027342 [Daucus carota]
MSRYHDLNDQLSGLNIEEEENTAFTFEDEVEDEINKQFLNRDTEEQTKEWGSWLRAQPRRNSGPVKSKWLREDGDSDWEERQGRVQVNAKSKESSLNIPENQSTAGNHLQIGGSKSYPSVVANQITDFQGGKIDSNFVGGPEEEEVIGLHLTERKRMRGGPDNLETMDTEGGLKIVTVKVQTIGTSDVELSKMDCSSSSKHDLATLALQASQQP